MKRGRGKEKVKNVRCMTVAIHNSRIYCGAEEIDDVEKRLPGIRGFNIGMDDVKTADSGRTHRYCTQSSRRSTKSSLSSAGVFICSALFEPMVLG